MKRILYIFLVLATVQTVCAQRKPSSFEGEYYLAGTFYPHCSHIEERI